MPSQTPTDFSGEEAARLHQDPPGVNLTTLRPQRAACTGDEDEEEETHIVRGID
ncbi:hypothetical protein [Streptomyces sp. Y7]|uniref:hypothetical protein n=1 Tax=Streptomyces sp. Y7 TaxID=3342392 RepID=UPI003715BDDC